MSLRFGTDGVRGPAEDLDDDLVVALGEAAVAVLGGRDGFVIGRDTRRSGPRIEAALARGMRTAGASPEVLGVAPTPAVAWASARRGAPGAVISASHNPWPDNGIKFFAAGGRKLSDEVEQQLEAALDDRLRRRVGVTVTSANGGAGDGSADTAPALLSAWLDAVCASTEGRTLAGLRVVLDCANGAASTLAPEAIERLGAEVDVLHARPDGTNINDGCGSTHPEDLRRRVVEIGADLGLAFDGDADRVLAVDEAGGLVDGDHLIALFALDLRARGRLAGDRVVVTVMTNLGFRLAMEAAGIGVVETAVGDRHVLEAMAAGGWSLGGEQSGHIVFADLATTGDGLLSGVQLLDLVRRSSRPLSALARDAMTRLPQVLVNVVVPDRAAELVAAVADAVATEAADLGSRGRVLLRPSGTEPLVRVMVEAQTEEQAAAAAERLARALRAAADHDGLPS
jgi:phosphoglucosamine mutase